MVDLNQRSDQVVARLPHGREEPEAQVVGRDSAEEGLEQGFVLGRRGADVEAQAGARGDPVAPFAEEELGLVRFEHLVFPSHGRVFSRLGALRPGRGPSVIAPKRGSAERPPVEPASVGAA